MNSEQIFQEPLREPWNHKILLEPLREPCNHEILLDADRAFCFRSLDDVLQSGLLRGGTSSDPVTLYIAPGVYWLHDPEKDDSPLFCNDRGLPCEKRVRFDWLKIVGLSDDPGQVVLAARKGQSFGCIGNYTMFSFEGKGLWVQNITLGNYCNVDLEYPRDPALSCPKRSGTITQAQLADFRGEKLVAENCRFVSRLNLMPICGAAQSTYRNCHFECTDDALNGHAVYEECDFDFYGGCPLWSTVNSGVIFQKCIFRIYTDGLRFVKHGGQIACLECRFESAGGPPEPPREIRNKELLIYELHNTWGGQPFSLRQLGLQTVPLDDSNQLAQDFLRREEDCPVCLRIDKSPGLLTYEDGSVKLHATVTAFSGRVLPDETVRFEAFPEKADRGACKREPFILSHTHRQECILRNCNESPEAVRLRILAHTDTGLRDETSLTLIPRHRPAPLFQTSPSLQREGMHLRAEYRLDIPCDQDNSLIVWYRIPQTDADIDENIIPECTADNWERISPVAVACGHGTDCSRYLPDMDDIGHWLFAEVTPACRYGKAGLPRRTNALKMTVSDISCPGKKETDFRFLPLEHKKGRGLFLFDEFIPTAEEMPPEWRKRELKPSPSAWRYGSLGGGCTGSGIYPMQQGSSVIYEPSRAAGRDMEAQITLDPAKTAGQGFGSSGQYLDILLRYSPDGRNGIGVRIKRTTRASDAVEFSLIRYSGGVSAPLTESKLVSCFLTGCRIFMEAKGNLLRAAIECDIPQSNAGRDKGRLHKADLSVKLVQNRGALDRTAKKTDTANAFCLIHTGTCGDGGWMNSILLHRLQIRYL